jgi:seryl-tRNA synthetase
MHLTEHTQLVENQSRTFFYSHERTLNDLNNKLQCLSISPRILESPFIQLEKWRTDAHYKLDQLAEQKRQEIETKISEYRIIFTKKTNEQKQKIELIRKRLNDLSRQTHVANKEMKYLEEKIDETKQFLQSIEKHSIKIATYDFFVNIRTQFFDLQPSRTVQPLSPVAVPSSNSTRNARRELREPVSNGPKQRFDKKRSLSVSLL